MLNLGVDSFNRNAFRAQFTADASIDAISHVAAVKAFADELRQQKQVIQISELHYR